MAEKSTTSLVSTLAHNEETYTMRLRKNHLKTLFEEAAMTYRGTSTSGAAKQKQSRASKCWKGVFGTPDTLHVGLDNRNSTKYLGLHYFRAELGRQ